MEPYSKKLGMDTWHYAKRCFLGLIENLAKHMIMVSGLFTTSLGDRIVRYGIFRFHTCFYDKLYNYCLLSYVYISTYIFKLSFNLFGKHLLKCKNELRQVRDVVLQDCIQFLEHAELYGKQVACRIQPPLSTTTKHEVGDMLG